MPLIIICKIHGEFKQSYQKHISGSGCNSCGNIKIGENVIVGAGAVVTKDIPSKSTVIGVPARLV